jgi:hypothetical protein
MQDKWNNLARDHANALNERLPDVPRGAYPTDIAGVCLAFAIDDFAHDDRARLTVTLLRRVLHDAGLPELGFGTSDDGRTWCMLVQTNDEQALTEALRDAHRIAFGR